MRRQTSRSGEAREPAARLLAWYDRHRRELPWRAPPGVKPDPYAVWLSEIMLQQTTVAAVKDYFNAFLALWPRVEDLAAAPTEEVMRRWAGLGYYARARNLHACAKAVAAAGGRFPDTEEGLRALPGIGPYTAAAIAAIAFDRHATVVDGNVERVIVRLHRIEQPIRAVKSEIRKFAAERTPPARSGDYAQAMMDLGATICTPRNPACVLCPLREDCLATKNGMQAILPIKSEKPRRPVRQGSVFYVRCGDLVLVRTRPTKGLLGGMTEFPGSDWTSDGDPLALAEPIAGDYMKVIGTVDHGFTHFSLLLSVYVMDLTQSMEAPTGCRWVREVDLAAEALPSLMRKVAAAAQERLRSSPAKPRHRQEVA